MNYFKKIKNAINWIETRPKFNNKKDLTRVVNAFNLFHINDSFRKIHVAGTNGKGSTTIYISNILISDNKKVGAFLSPYLVKFNERIRLNMEEISDKTLLKYINDVYELNEEFYLEYGVKLSFFELLTLVALKYFSDEKCDYVVMEVGIGGLFDATNIMNYDISVITNIGFDHMKQLGNTLESIALNKLGILKPNGTLITGVSDGLKGLFTEYTSDLKVKLITPSDYQITSNNPLTFIFENETYELKMKGSYQVKNAILAILVAKELGIDNKIVKEGLLSSHNPGRFEIVTNNPLTIIDGAHNIHGIDALVESVNDLNIKDIQIIFSALADKEIDVMLDKLQEIGNVTLVSFNDERVFNPLKYCMSHNVKYIKDLNMAYKMIKNKVSNNGLILITGSIHFIGYVKKNLRIK